MKQNKVKLYARALADLALKEPASAKATAWQSNFLALIKKNNLEKKVKQIVAMAEDLILAKQGKNKITFEIARRITAENRALLKKFVKEGDVVKEKVNHELIAGVKIIINENKQFDASMARKLQKIF